MRGGGGGGLLASDFHQTVKNSFLITTFFKLGEEH